MHSFSFMSGSRLPAIDCHAHRYIIKKNAHIVISSVKLCILLLFTVGFLTIINVHT